MSGLDDLDDLLGQLEGTKVEPLSPKEAPPAKVYAPTEFKADTSSATVVRVKFLRNRKATRPDVESVIPEIVGLKADGDDEMAAALAGLIGGVVDSNKPKELKIVLHP